MLTCLFQLAAIIFVSYLSVLTRHLNKRLQNTLSGGEICEYVCSVPQILQLQFNGSLSAGILL